MALSALVETRREDENLSLRRSSRALVSLVLVCLPLLVACNDYRVRFLYPRENRGDFFSERPEVSLYVAEPEDLRPSAERRGSGMFGTLQFPSDDKYDQPPSRVVLRALLQDLGQTRVANLVRNPDNADYLLDTQLLSMTTRLERRLSAWAIPLAAGVAIGGLSQVGGSGGGIGDAVKVGAVGFVLGTMLPAPARATGQVQVRMRLRDRATGEVVWETTCTGESSKSVRQALSARNDQKLAERYLPAAMKRANACAVGQLYAFLQEHQVSPEPRGR